RGGKAMTKQETHPNQADLRREAGKITRENAGPGDSFPQEHLQEGNDTILLVLPRLATLRSASGMRKHCGSRWKPPRWPAGPRACLSAT
ncbi:MAG: hypothetical protein ACOYOS_24215, partial [Syntrophales bacterium]